MQSGGSDVILVEIKLLELFLQNFIGLNFKEMYFIGRCYICQTAKGSVENTSLYSFYLLLTIFGTTCLWLLSLAFQGLKEVMIS